MQHDIEPAHPKPTALVAVFSNILGVQLAIKLLGQDMTDKLAKADSIPRRLPLAKPWLASPASYGPAIQRCANEFAKHGTMINPRLDRPQSSKSADAGAQAAYRKLRRTRSFAPLCSRTFIR